MKKYNNKRTIAIFLAIAMAAGALTGCASIAQSPDTSPQTGSAAAVQTAANPISPVSAEITGDDITTVWDEGSSTKVNLNGASISVDGSGAAASGGTLTITKAGTYVISGTLADGQIVVDATNNDLVRLVLNGANITNAAGAPIYAPQCDKLVITLPDGTANALTDGGAGFKYALAADEEPNAALFCKDDLTINGTGTLTVNALFNNGIGTKDDLLIVGGNLIVNAANHGLRGNDSVTVLGGGLKVTAGNDGMQTNNADEAGKGFILIEGGAFEIVCARDAVQADTALTVIGGDFKVTVGGGYNKAGAVPSSGATSDSFKGLKSAGDILITGGDFAIDSYDDSIHASGNINISGGALALATGDDGIHAGGDLTLSGEGTAVTVTTSYEGLEAANITIADGIINVTATDDGINAAGGSDQNTGGGPFGKDSFMQGGDYSINISGGSVTVSAGGDGIDSNGAVNISGGFVVSIINSTPDNGAVDCDGTFTLTGGAVIYGGTGTGTNPGGSSTQSYVYVGSGVAAGSELTVRKDGNTLISFTPAAACQYLALSSPDIAANQTYEVYSGASLLTTATAGTGGGMGGGQRGQGGPGGFGGPGDFDPQGAHGDPGARGVPGSQNP